MVCKDSEARRDYVIGLLIKLGFQVHFKPQGSFFIFAELPENWLFSDVDFVENLIKKAGVAAVPGCGFFHPPTNGQRYQRRYVRFAFCKSIATLTAASERISELVSGKDDSMLRK
ncbi:hypothetical protein Taro_017658 [Colocasia esculenta]|uniref:Uncharacterized protein n=1 Tax=Colocasia esculenta TaxID=4460 RepID=A0A843UTZ5_COLES|nr:hypothetical protein [Colocasia esculenta]